MDDSLVLSAFDVVHPLTPLSADHDQSIGSTQVLPFQPDHFADGRQAAEPGAGTEQLEWRAPEDIRSTEIHTRLESLEEEQAKHHIMKVGRKYPMTVQTEGGGGTRTGRQDSFQTLGTDLGWKDCRVGVEG